MGQTKKRTSTFGNVRKLPSGRYQASYWHEGKRYTAPRTFDTKADADAWLSKVRTSIGGGGWVDPDAGAVTFGDYSTKWLEQRHDLAITSRELYRQLLDGHILPTFGAVKLAKVTTASVRAWNASLAATLPTTAAKSYRLMATIFKTAVEDGHVVASPVRVRGAAAEKAPERPMATVAEVQALADAMPDDMRLAVLLAAWCQLRRGELLGLRRKDVNVLRGTITVAVTKVKTMGGVMIEKAPKTEAGRRTIAVPTNVLSVLSDHLDSYVEAAPDALILPKGYKPLRTAWQKARKTVGVTYRLHDLRHAGLTWTAATGATIAELMHRAGHASPIAALRYQHATAERDRVLADALAQLAPRADVLPITSEAG